VGTDVRFFAALRMTCLLLTATVAWAEDAPPEPPSPTDLEPMVVTATRTEQPAFELPASIDQVGAAEINANKLGVNLSEDLNAIAGVLVRDRQNYAQDQQIMIRGFGTRAPFGIVGTRLYVDGIPASMPDGQGQVSHFNLSSAERIEVLRGPFSALYGNASSGVIQIFTAPAVEKFQAQTEAVGGSFGALRTSLNLRGASAPANYNLDYTHFQTDGYRDHSSAKRESGNVRVAIDMGARASLTLLGNVVSIPDAEDPQGVTREQFDADPRQVGPAALTFNTRKSVRQWHGGLVGKADVGGDSTLQGTGYYGAREVKQFLSVPVAVQTDNEGHSGGVVDLDNQYAGGDLRWIVQRQVFGRPWSVVAGLAYESQDSDRRGYENFVGDELGVQGELRRDEANRTWDFSQYLQSHWDFAERWSAIVGLRHSAVHFDSEDHYVTGPENPDDSGGQRFSEWTPVAGLLFRAGERVRLYASYGEGFDTPTFVEIAYKPSGESGLNTDLGPASSDHGELGVKWRFGARSFANAALFYAQTEDEIVVAGAQGGRNTFRNGGDARRQGGEVEASLAFHELLRLQLAYTYVDAQFRPSGRPIPGVPEHSTYAALRYGGQTGWKTALESTFVSRVPVSTGNDDGAPAYALLGLNGGYTWDWPSWRLTSYFRLDNLLSRPYVGSVIINDANGRYYEPGPARSVFGGLELTWRLR
jgi:iron complex outermembrane recepter protein